MPGMASYYDAYDSRVRSSRRTDSFSRSREDGLLKPTAGASETRRRVGETASDVQKSDSRSQRSPNRYAYGGYDTRYDYPPPLPPSSGRPPSRREASPRRRETSRLRKRRSYPPPPKCEDEATSLAREAGSQKLLQELGKDEIPSRGTIDQEVLVEDVPELINKDERRFVLRPTGAHANQPTPPTSDDEKARRRAKRRPSKLDMNFKKVESDVPELQKRTASPYAMSKDAEKPPREATSSRFLSPDNMLSPPPTDSGARRTMPISRSQPNSPRRDSAKYGAESGPGDDYFSMGSDSAITDDEYYDARGKAKNKPATYPPSRDAPNPSPQTSVVDFAPSPAPQSQPSSSSASIRRLNLDARRNTDTESTLPTMRRLDSERTRRTNPLMTAGALSGLGVPVVSSPQATLSTSEFPRPRSRESSYANSRGPSPAGSAVSATEGAAPERSPRMSAEFGREDSYDDPPTRTSSICSSRPQSPSPRTPAESPRLPKSDLDWSTLLAANASRKGKGPSRLSSEFVVDSNRPVSRGNASKQPPPPSRVESLPYPDDDGPSTPSVWMPSERSHQYFPDTRMPTHVFIREEPQSESRSASIASGSNPYPPAGPARPTRPSMPTRHSAADVPQVPKQPPAEKPRASEAKRAAFATSSQTKKDLQSLSTRPLPPCARMMPVMGYHDWYTMTGAPYFNFCPECVSDVFDRTMFRNSFRRSPPMNLDTPVQCALGGMQWVRLAWLMTLQQNRTDLRLLEDLAHIEETSSPCPGDNPAARTWYGLRDKDGYFLKDFRLCYNDVRKIEALLPSLGGLFVRLPQRTADEVGLCAIRSEGSRFSIYIDALIKTHEKAKSSGSRPDTGPFISLVQWRSQLRECKKDGLLRNALWHFVPGLPELTVCEGMSHRSSLYSTFSC